MSWTELTQSDTKIQFPFENNKINRLQIEDWGSTGNREFTIKTDKDSNNLPTITG